MLDKSSFRSIRSFGGSQEGGFEELICQLAHLAPPLKAKSFIRKEGAGGDAGVECFWIMEDGSEHAWQAKYFLEEMTPSRWSQIDKSVKKAIEKHPNLTKYYVCFPLDRTDTRSTGPGGRQTISVLDEWNQKVKEWGEYTSKEGKHIDFEYWGVHEILLPLHSEDPKYSGRALYWFNDIVLTNEKFKQCLIRQEKTLGERYTPEFHVDLPIAKTLEGLINGDSFWSQLNQKAVEWNKSWSSFCLVQPPQDLKDSLKNLRESLKSFKKFLDSVAITRDRTRLAQLQREYDEATRHLYSFYNKCKDSKEANERPTPHSRCYTDEVIAFIYREHEKISDFLSSSFVNANISSAVLVTGEAGAGKSHLLCDFAKNLIDSEGPAILMLGQHYRGGNPLEELLDLIDLKSFQYETVLGAIDAAGEAAGVNAILLIDAINEGSHRDEWRERIVGLLEDIRRFPHIGIVISCRSRFDGLLVPSHIQSNELLRVSHLGFRGHEHKAASIYLTKQGIAKPTTPITAPEFSNPLFLKTCAFALKQAGETSWPKGYQGMSRLFEIYLSSLELVVSRKRGTEVHDRLCKKALEALSNEMFPDSLFGIPWDRASTVIHKIDTCSNPTESLLQTLLREGALSDDIEYSLGDTNTPEPIVRFAYERFCDQFVAQLLLQGVSDPAELFNSEHPIGKAVAENRHFQFDGILTALSITIPEKYEVEFWDLLPDNIKSHRQSAEFYFFDSLPYRAPSSFTARTQELFNSLETYDNRFSSRRLDLLIQFATEPSHPWNGERLHRMLLNFAMPERDSVWSVYVAQNDYSEEFDEGYEQPESPIRSIIEWATFGDLSFVGQEQARLSLITLIWLGTTTNRKTRDQATKATSRLFAQFPDLIVSVLDTFLKVDDLYLQERLYASIYGGLCNTENDNHLKAVAKRVFEIQFKDNKPATHLLLRDYARSIVELALARGCIHKSIVIDNCRPPYESEWPLETSAVQESDDIRCKIHDSIFFDDFGRYTMSIIDSWSPTPREHPQPESQVEVVERLKGTLSESAQQLLSDAIRLTQVHEMTRGHNEILKVIETGDMEVEDASINISSLEDILAMISNSEATTSDLPSSEEVDLAWKKFNDCLDDSTRESFSSARGYCQYGDIIASYSRRRAENWVYKYAIELGWTSELFKDFEDSLPYSGRDRPKTERIGKKYQRIALFTLLAHLADNVHYKGDAGFSDIPEPSVYRGPWQPWKRDIDPTHWLRKTSDSGWDEWNSNVWWRPFDYKFRIASDTSKLRWCEDTSDLPKFERYIRISDNSNTLWYSLKGFSEWREKMISGDNSKFSRDIWFRMNSILVNQSDLARLQVELKDKDYISSSIVSSTSTGHQTFLREYPWHPSARVQDRFEEAEAWGEIKSPHIVPYVEYEWESGSGDQSAEMNLSLYIPSSYVIEKMILNYDRSHFDRWTDNTGNTVFLDPSLEFDGPSFALFNCRMLDKMLTSENLALVWLIGGEKMIFNESKSKLVARMVFNSMLWTLGDGKIQNVSHNYMEH